MFKSATNNGKVFNTDYNFCIHCIINKGNFSHSMPYSIIYSIPYCMPTLGVFILYYKIS